MPMAANTCRQMLITRCRGKPWSVAELFLLRVIVLAKSGWDDLFLEMRSRIGSNPQRPHAKHADSRAINWRHTQAT